MKRNFLVPAGLFAACLGTIAAAEINIGTATPPAGDGVQNLSFSTGSADNTTHDFVPSNSIASDVNGGEQLAIGQSFTTGSNAWGYQLNSISVRQVSWGPTNWDFDGGQVTCRIFKVTSDLGWGFESTEVATQTVSIANVNPTTLGGTPGSPAWMTFTLTAPLALESDAQYAFVFKSDAPLGGASNNFLMECDGTDADSMVGGTSITVPDGVAVLWKGGGNSDRAFVANMTLPTVPPVPEFVVNPENKVVAVYQSVTFSSSAPADPEPEYQWQYSADGINGWSDLAGETGRNLQFSVAITDEGYYRCVATNPNGSDVSAVAFLDAFYAQPSFYLSPGRTFAAAGSEVILNGDALTYGNASYQWFKDGVAIDGATTNTLTIPSLGASDQGGYMLQVTDDIEPGLVSDSEVASVGILELQIASSATAPGTAASDQYFLPVPEVIADADNIGGGNDNFTFIAEVLGSIGMSFTTGSDPLGYRLDAITIRQAFNPTWADVQPGDIFGLSFGTLDGTTKNELYRRAATYAGDAIVKANQPGDGVFLTFDLSGATAVGTLAPNTQYYFEIKSFLGNAFIEWNGLAAGNYTGGEAFGGDSAAAITPGYIPMTGDRVFHAKLAGLSNAGNTFASWIAGFPAVGSENGFTDDPDRDGLSNGEENFFGTNPTVPSASTTNIRKAGNTLVFEHLQNPAKASDVSAAYRWTTDLANWHAAGATAEGTTVQFTTAADTPAPGITTVTATLSGNIPGKVFADLEVIQTSSN